MIFTLTPQAGGNTEFTLRQEFSGPMIWIFGRKMPDMTSALQELAAEVKSRAETAESET
jgi:hypothetical protein